MTMTHVTPAQAAKSACLLFIASAIWGLAFVVQKQSLEHMGAWWFTGWRFIIGGLCLLPLLVFIPHRPRTSLPILSHWQRFSYMLWLGLSVAAGANLQQLALQYTSVTNVGFITSLYVVLVPILLFVIWQRRIHLYSSGGIAMATVGLICLSIFNHSEWQLNSGDLLVFACTIFWATHVILLGLYTRYMSALSLSAGSFLICGIVSLTIAWFFDTPFHWHQLKDTSLALAYAGILSVGVGFTIQAIGQKYLSPVVASVILSLEAVNSAFAGWLILNERLTLIAFIGCLLVIIGGLIVQIYEFKKHQAVPTLTKTNESTQPIMNTPSS